MTTSHLRSITNTLRTPAAVLSAKQAAHLVSSVLLTHLAGQISVGSGERPKTHHHISMTTLNPYCMDQC